MTLRIARRHDLTTTASGTRRRVARFALGAIAASIAVLPAAGHAAADPSSAATVLTVSGATTLVTTPMEQELRGDLCRAPRTCRKVDYPSGQVGGYTLEIGLANLDKAINATPGPKTVFGYSQGAIIASMWLQQKAAASTVPGADLTFVLAGNAQRGENGKMPLTRTGIATPTSTRYKVVDISRQYDGLSDYPDNQGNYQAVQNANSGYATVHADYTGVNLNDPSNLVKRVDNTYYVVNPTQNLPVLDGYRRWGLGWYADAQQPALKAKIDAAYNRSNYRTIAQNGAVDPYPSA